MNELQEKLKQLFLRADESFRRENQDLFEYKVNERTLCGALMIHLNDVIRSSCRFNKYKVDVEYNRNRKKKVKTFVHFDSTEQEVKVNINCDLVVHGRGRVDENENLIVLEMKKFNSSASGIKASAADKYRLIALTKKANTQVWPVEGSPTDIDHICDYQLGIYYEIDFKKHYIHLEFYCDGNIVETTEYDYYIT